MDLLHHGLRLHEDLVFGEPRDPESKLPKHRIALCVAPQPQRLAVLRAVHLDDEIGAQAAEVHDVPRERMLTTEPDSELAASQTPPEALLGIGRAPPKGTRL